MRKIFQDRFTIAAFTAGLIAGLIGLSYLAISSAPMAMIAVNGTAIALAISFAAMAKIFAPSNSAALPFLSVSAALFILATALFGYTIADASRWLLLGPFFIQTSLVFLPLIALSFARVQTIWTLVAVLVAGLAVAIQPDRAMSAMLFAAVATIYWVRPNKLTLGGAIFCAFGLCITILSPDRLPAVPFVDHILWTAFDIHLLVGASLWFGCLLLLCPIVFVGKNGHNAVHYTFVACWLTLIAASAMGAYPTPIVGYGASSILGYFLSITLIKPNIQPSIKRDVAGLGTSALAKEDDTSLRKASGKTFTSDMLFGLAIKNAGL